MKIVDGKYTVVLENGKHLNFKVKTCRQGNLAGKALIGYLARTNEKLIYKNFGFVNGKFIIFWKKFRESQSPAFISMLETATKSLQTDVYQAVKTYAIKTGTCFVCYRKLINPESVAAGIGPECRRRLMI